MSITPEVVRHNRLDFIQYLRDNPDNKTQIHTSELYQPYGKRFFDGQSPQNVCAIGLGCDMLSIDYTSPKVEPYREFADALGLDMDPNDELGSSHPFTITHIWWMSDSAAMSWKDMANQLEREWFGSV